MYECVSECETATVGLIISTGQASAYSSRSGEMFLQASNVSIRNDVRNISAVPLSYLLFVNCPLRVIATDSKGKGGGMKNSNKFISCINKLTRGQLIFIILDS